MKSFKQALALCLSFLFLLSPLCALAAEDSILVRVTLSDAGELTVSASSVTVTDTDADGVFSVNDALVCAHDAFYPGGAAAGYASEATSFGWGITRLWGVANGGWYGFFINHAPATAGLGDPLQNGDTLTAYTYKDTAGGSDLYTYFENEALSVKEGETVTLVLKSAGYDASWNPVTDFVRDARLLVDGAPSSFRTNANGSVTLPLPVGTHLISAQSDSVIVPPACRITVLASEATAPPAPRTSDTTQPLLPFCLSLILALAVAETTVQKRKKTNEE